MPKTLTRTLQKLQTRNYRQIACPFCNETTQVRDNAALTVIKTCCHFVRRWRVTADHRIRVAFNEAAQNEAQRRSSAS